MTLQAPLWALDTPTPALPHKPCSLHQELKEGQQLPTAPGSRALPLPPAALTKAKAGGLAGHPAGPQAAKLGEGILHVAVGDACRSGSDSGGRVGARSGDGGEAVATGSSAAQRLQGGSVGYENTLPELLFGCGRPADPTGQVCGLAKFQTCR